MKKNILLAAAGLLVSAANLAYASQHRTTFTTCSDYRCKVHADCDNLSVTCNYCFPYPFPGPECYNMEEQ